MTLVAAAGTPLAEVESALDDAGQMLAFEPMDHRVLLGTGGAPTVGGMAAVNASGPRRVQAGACRDAMLGVRFVDGAGQVIQNGGRVMKNVTGYDLVKMMAGSRGTLGVLTEVSLKVQPRPEAVATVVLRGMALDAAVAAMSDALGSPFDVSGAAHDVASGETLIRVEGFAGSAAYRAEALAKRLARFGAAEIVDGGDRWRDVRDVRALAGYGSVWQLSVRPSRAADLAARLGGGFGLLLDWGGGRVWGGSDEDRLETLRAALAATGGHGLCVKGARAGERAGAQSGGVARLEAGLRAQFDPRGILNAGPKGAAA